MAMAIAVAIVDSSTILDQKVPSQSHPENI